MPNSVDADDTIGTSDGFSSLFESLPDGVILFDSDGRKCHANSRFDVMWPTSEQPFEPDADLDRTLQAVMRLACTKPGKVGRTDDLAQQIAHQGDAVTAVEMEVVGRPIMCRISGTAAGGTMLSFSDIEKWRDAGRTRHAMTDELIDAVAHQMPGLIGQIDGDGRYVYANRFRDFAEASGDWFWETDLDQRFTYVSPRGDPSQSLFQDRDLIGNSRSMVHAEFGVDDTVVPRIQSSMDRGHPFRDVELCLTAPDKPAQWLQLSGQPVLDDFGKIASYRGVAVDITARKRAEEALRESEERYRRLAQLLPDAVRVVINDRVVFANVAAAKLLGVESPKRLSDFPSRYFLDPSDQAVLNARTARVDRGETVPWREHSLRALEGKEVTVESAMAPIVWDGKPSRLLVSRDTTRHKQVEDQLRQAMEEAKQANVAKSRFLAAASHDLRQPIQALGLLNAALAYDVDDPSLKEITANMGHAIDAMRSVLDALLDISKLEAGVVTPEFSVFPIAPLIDRIVGELSFEAHAKGLELRAVSSSAHVRSDRDLLERVVQNFVSNAIRYTKSGRILIGCRRQGSNLQLQIWDTGPGIEADQQERIFEEFYQLDNPARDRSKLLGLGLAIVERLARLLDHPIKVRSDLGLGSMFSVVLPVEVGDETMVDQRDPLPMIELNGKRILILDDDEGVVEATMSLLSRWGADVLGAHTADEALRLASAVDQRPDLVIVDYVLSDGETGTDMA